MKKIILYGTVTILAACGGGGGGNDFSNIIDPPPPPPPAQTATISGSVAGTTILVLNDSGQIVSIADTADKAKDVDTDGDGIRDAFSFALADIPLLADLRAYLIADGAIYPMYFDTNSDGIADANVFNLASEFSGDLPLGFVDTERDENEDGMAIPTNNPILAGNVTSKGAIAEIPLSINEPPTAGFGIAELNAKGRRAVVSGWVLGARTYYKAAENLAPGSVGNDADMARFMFALTRIAALGYDSLSDGDARNLDRLGDFFDLIGIPNNHLRANPTIVFNDLTKPYPNDSPMGNDVRDYTYNRLRAELQAAAQNLDEVSEAFDALIEVDGETTNVDYGDALALSGYLRSVIASIEIESAYDWGVDIDDIWNNNRQVEDVLAANETKPGIPEPAKMDEARASVEVALARLKSAIDVIVSETDNQSDDLITIDTDPITGAEEYKTWIDQTQASMNGEGTQIARVSVNLQAFFNNGIVLDDTTLPGFKGNELDPADGFFDDPTMGGVILDTDTDISGIQDLNEDTDDYYGPDILSFFTD